MPDAPDLNGSHVSLALVVARFNETITSRLLDGARKACELHAVKSHDVHWVPGSFELPQLALHLAKSGRYDAVVCLGAVIRHETDHYLHISTQAAAGIQHVAVTTGVPCAFGVLTCDTGQQALDRSNDRRNIGAEAVATAIQMANAIRSLK